MFATSTTESIVLPGGKAVPRIAAPRPSVEQQQAVITVALPGGNNATPSYIAVSSSLLPLLTPVVPPVLRRTPSCSPPRAGIAAPRGVCNAPRKPVLPWDPRIRSRAESPVRHRR